VRGSDEVGERRAHRLADGEDQAFRHLGEKFVLVLEVVVHHSERHPAGLGYAADGQRGDTLLRGEHERGIDELSTAYIRGKPLHQRIVCARTSHQQTNRTTRAPSAVAGEVAAYASFDAVRRFTCCFSGQS